MFHMTKVDQNENNIHESFEGIFISAESDRGDKSAELNLKHNRAITFCS